MATDTTAADRAWRDAYGRTEEALVRLTGLTHGLYELASESPQLNNPQPMSNAILSLIVCIEEKVAAAQAAHEAEHDAYHAKAKPC